MAEPPTDPERRRCQVPKVVSDQEKTARFRTFWTRSQTDRPLIGATIATFPSLRAVRCAAGLVEPDDLDIQENLKELDEEWEAWREVMGDAMFVANPLWAFPGTRPWPAVR